MVETCVMWVAYSPNVSPTLRPTLRLTPTLRRRPLSCVSTVEHRPNITTLLEAVGQGDAGAAERLLLMVYDELRGRAARELAGRAPHETLQATALVSEAYLRLFSGVSPTWENRRHFFFAAARAMRDIIVEKARRQRAQKRGGGRRRIDLDVDCVVGEQWVGPGVLEIEGAMEALREHDARCADIVLLRFFGGLTHAQVADTLRVSEARVRREWAYARAWLRKHLEE